LFAVRKAREASAAQYYNCDVMADKVNLRELPIVIVKEKTRRKGGFVIEITQLQSPHA